MTKRAAIYLRVSKDGQTLENQRPDVMLVVQTRGHEFSSSYEENVGATRVRPEFARMMRDAHGGAFDVLVIWSLDRLGRSMIGNMQIVLELDRCGVQVVSVREPWLDTGGAVRQLLIAIFSWVAEQERAQIVARTKAGLERTRRRGTKLGRPRANIDVMLAHELKAQGNSVRKIAQRLKATKSSVERALQRPKNGVNFLGSKVSK